MNTKPLKKDTSPDRHQCICPWWLCFTFDNVLRRFLQNPDRILKPYVKPGWTVLDIGPGIGYFTIPLARLVGVGGKVIAADLQLEMLEGINRRARRAGLQNRIRLQKSTPDNIEVNESIDFGLAFWMLHEVPNRSHLLGQIATLLKKDGLLLIAEPHFHVSQKDFAQTLGLARSAGLHLQDQPKIFLSYSALLQK